MNVIIALWGATCLCLPPGPLISHSIITVSPAQSYIWVS